MRRARPAALDHLSSGESEQGSEDSAPPSPPNPAELDESAPAAADLDASEAPAAAPAELLPQPLSGQEERDDAVHKVDGVGESPESVADVAAAIRYRPSALGSRSA